jgi:hypothetical protein
MKSLTQNEIKNNIVEILNMVQKGEDILIRNDKNKKSMAVIISYQKYKKNKDRPLGILKGKAKYKLETDYNVTDEELLIL